jgi:SAM-dependent methyltransferase
MKLNIKIRKFLPSSLRRFLIRSTRWPPISRINFHNLRRLEPISRSFGGDRGLPLDRYYIEQFLSNYSGDIRGHVLEIGGNVYTRKFGSNKIVHSDVLHIVGSNPQATLIGDLSNAPQIQDNTFDCIICTQTLQFIPDVESTIRTLRRILKPKGVVLATVPIISQLDIVKDDQWIDYWRFTAKGITLLFTKHFALEDVQVHAYGNVLTAISFLHGLSTEELAPHELQYSDPAYNMVVAVHAVKRDSPV